MVLETWNVQYIYIYIKHNYPDLTEFQKCLTAFELNTEIWKIWTLVSNYIFDVKTRKFNII